MPVFSRGKPITTRAPQITVDDLPPGRHRFTLVVRDDAGNVSAGASAAVVVVEGRPTPNPIIIKDDAIRRPDPRPIGLRRPT